MIHLLEELSFNAWPALQTVHYDGWLLRFADGYTRRANSVNPIYPSSLTLDEKIEYCEQIYRSREQDTVFKISPVTQPSDLDDELERRSYRKEAITSVQTLDLGQVDLQGSMPANITFSQWLTDEWLTSFCALNHLPSHRRPTMERMLSSIIPTAAYAALKQGEETLAVGLAVQEREFVGLFDIVTAVQYRRQGLGTQAIHALLQWGKRQGATHAYLQVMMANAPALRLYGSLGFSELYRYWYRIRRFHEDD